MFHIAQKVLKIFLTLSQVKVRRASANFVISERKLKFVPKSSNFRPLGLMLSYRGGSSTLLDFTESF